MPVAVIHIFVDGLLMMRCRHGLGQSGYFIRWKAWRNMGCKMPFSNCPHDFKWVHQFQSSSFCHTASEIDNPLAAYVIYDECLVVARKPFQSLTYWIVHVNLPNVYHYHTGHIVLLLLHTSPLFENRQHSAESWRHVLHMHRHPCPLNPNAADEHRHYFGPDGYYM